MLYPRTGLILVLLTIFTACTVMQMETANTEAGVFTKPKPEFPNSELVRGREGWVMIAYYVNSSGLVGDSGIEDSSGNDAFEKAAQNAVRQWRYKPGEERELRALLNFVYDRKVVKLSRRFISLNNRVHELVDKGDVEAAQELLDEIRDDNDLTAYELAYSYLTEGRIVGEGGDQAGQLRNFRKAMLSEGRWLARENYLKCLHVAVILEIDLKDFATAVRDYELLTETGVGMKLAADLEESIQAIRVQVERDQDVASPYVAANSIVSVKEERLSFPPDSGTRPHADDRDIRPRPSPPPKKQ